MATLTLEGVNIGCSAPLGAHEQWAAVAKQRRAKWLARLRVAQTRRAHRKAWKAWRLANEIRQRVAAMTGNRNGPAKAWADECRIMLARAERAHRRALQYGH